LNRSRAVLSSRLPFSTTMASPPTIFTQYCIVASVHGPERHIGRAVVLPALSCHRRKTLGIPLDGHQRSMVGLRSPAGDKAWRDAGTGESDQAEKTPVTFLAVYSSQCSPSP
jgi:hypothetical protein